MRFPGRETEQRCLALLQSCKTLSYLTQIHALILKLGLHNNPLVLTKFASTSSDLDAIDYASSFLFSPESDSSLYDSFLFNTIIRAYAQTINSKEKAVVLYKNMLEFNVLPNKFTYPFVLKACAGIKDLNLGKSVHGSTVKFGFDEDEHVRNSLVNMYCRGGSEGIEIARKLFDEMPNWDSVGWSAMIAGYGRLGRYNEAIDLFRGMLSFGVRPDDVTMIAVVAACTELGALDVGKWVELYIEKEKVEKSVQLCNALIDMFSKCGDVDEAMKLFRSMNEGERTIVSWTSVIVGLAMHGRGVDAVAFFEEMIRSGIVLDRVSFTGLLSACSHSGLVDKGREYFDLMRKDFGIVPEIEQYGCMVDMLCRAGLVREAFVFVQEMHIEPNSVIWRTLINACRAHGELKLGERISRELIINEPMQESNYVLLSNIYAKMSDWEKKNRIRKVMDKKGMKKVPGSTMIMLDDKICRFEAGDECHNQSSVESCSDGEFSSNFRRLPPKIGESRISPSDRLEEESASWKQIAPLYSGF